VEYTDYDTRLAAYAVITDDVGRVLLSHYIGGGAADAWLLPGGGVEFDESPEEGVLREVTEETGYTVEVDALLAVLVRTRPARTGVDGALRPRKAVQVLFRAHVIGGVLTHEVGGSTDQARWFTLGELADQDRTTLVDSGLAAAGIEVRRRAAG
jgi:8-oxo-dGTP diphosphatase